MPKIESKSRFDNTYLPYILIAPSLLLMCLVIIYPLLRGVYMSFTDYNILHLDSANFIGLENYKKLVLDKDFWEVIAFTFIYVFGTVILSYIIGLIIALILNRDFKGRNIFRAVLLLPWIIAWVVAANSWLWILDYQTGFINNFLSLLGMPSINFFGSSLMAKITVILINGWKSFPFMMLVILAGLQNIPKELYESAYMDGANKIKSFIYITFPGIKQVTVLSTILMTIWVFNGFESIYLVTQGGPVRATYTISILTYRTAFYTNKLGFASAVATSLMAFMVIFSMIYTKITNSEGEEL